MRAIMNLWFCKHLLYCVEITESQNRCLRSHCLSFSVFALVLCSEFRVHVWVGPWLEAVEGFPGHLLPSPCHHCPQRSFPISSLGKSFVHPRSSPPFSTHIYDPRNKGAIWDGPKEPWMHELYMPTNTTIIITTVMDLSIVPVKIGTRDLLPSCLKSEKSE